MTAKSKKYLIITVISLIIFAVLFQILGFVIGIAATIVLAIALYYFLGTMQKNSSSDRTSNHSQANDLSDEEKSLNALLDINLQLRKTIIAKMLREQFEALIDQLIGLLPKINQTDSASELAWVINRMATEYLPKKSIKPYLLLTEIERLDETVISSVEKGIHAMRDELIEVEQLIATRNTNEFKNKAHFLEQRFTTR